MRSTHAGHSAREDQRQELEEEEGPDLLLREAARIVADMFELGSDMELLERQFVQLSEKTLEDS